MVKMDIFVPHLMIQRLQKIELLSDVRKRNEMKPFCREMAAKFDNSVSFEQMQKIYDEMA